MTIIDKPFLKKIRPEIEAALAEVGKRFGVELTLGNASYADTYATFKLNVATIGDNGELNTKKAEEFKRYAPAYGLKSDDFGREFRSNGDRFKITGLNTRAHRHPVIAESLSNGKEYKFSLENIKMYLQMSGSK